MFSGKTSSGGSSGSSSEKTPLLNGSQEGPCYAYSYGNSREDEEEEEEIKSADKTLRSKEKLKSIFRIFIMFVLITIILFSVVSLIFIQIPDDEWNSVIMTVGKHAHMNVIAEESFQEERIHLRVKGPFLPSTYCSISRNFITFSLLKFNLNGTTQEISQIWRVPIVSETENNGIDAIILEHDFDLAYNEISANKSYQLSMVSNKRIDYFSLLLDISVEPTLDVNKIIMAVCILVGFHILIMFEVVHRTLAAMIGATSALACLVIVGERPSLVDVLTWIDLESLAHLVGMMILISILCETGFFEYIAVLFYKIEGGHIWLLIASMYLLTGVISALVGEVVAVLLMSSVAMRLCEAMNVDPKHVLISLVMFANIGGAVVPNDMVQKRGEFGNFTLHVLPAVILSFVTAYVFWRLRYRDMCMLRFVEPVEVIEVKREMEVWRRTYISLSSYTRDEETVRAILKRKMSVLETVLRKKLYDSKISEEDYRTSLKELTSSMKVNNRPLLIKSAIIVGIVIIMLFVERNFYQLNINLGWISVLGALSLLVLGDFDGSIFRRIEWSTVLFIASIFVIMEALLRLDLVWYMVKATQDVIGGVEESNRLLVALVLIIWVSALSSSLLIPFTSILVQVLPVIANDGNMPFKPLMFALFLGSCLGGNGTLIGSTANVVSAGFSEEHCSRFSYWDFFKAGFPIMLLTTTLSMAYLLICHVWIGWND